MFCDDDELKEHLSCAGEIWRHLVEHVVLWNGRDAALALGKGNWMP